MKILYVAASPVPSKSANSVHVAKMAQALSRNGHKVKLLAPGNKRDINALLEEDIFKFYAVDKIFDFKQFPLYPTRLGTLLYVLYAGLQAKLMRADFIFTRCLPTAVILAKLGIPVLFERHSDFSEREQLNYRMYKALVKCRSCLGTVVVSQALKEYFVTEFSLDPDRVIVAADGSDPLPSLQMPSPFLKRPSRKNIGYIGHLYPGRGIDVIAGVARMRPDVDFHLVGGTVQDLDYWREELKDIPNVFLYGHIPHAQTKAYLVNFDVVLAPYQSKVSVAGGGHTERWMSPLKIFEYLSSKKPLLCSDIPVLHEVLVPEVNCLLCPPADVEAWAQALDRLLTDEPLAERISLRAFEDFNNHYTWQQRAHKILSRVFPETSTLVN